MIRAKWVLSVSVPSVELTMVLSSPSGLSVTLIPDSEDA